MALPRNKLVYRLPAGRLWIDSAIDLDETAMPSLERLGEPAWLVVPNVLHTMDAPAYRQRYPALKTLCPVAAREAIAKKVPDARGPSGRPSKKRSRPWASTCSRRAA
jgi:hypothetical protein